MQKWFIVRTKSAQKLLIQSGKHGGWKSRGIYKIIWHWNFTCLKSSNIREIKKLKAIYFHCFFQSTKGKQTDSIMFQCDLPASPNPCYIGPKASYAIWQKHFELLLKPSIHHPFHVLKISIHLTRSFGVENGDSYMGQGLDYMVEGDIQI